MDNRTYDAMVADLYRAATGAIEWERALEGVRQSFDARCVPLQTVNLQTGTLLTLYSGGPDMDRPALEYLREWHSLDPRAQFVAQHPVGEWMHCHDHLDDEFAANDPFYQEFLPSYDSRYVSGLLTPVDQHTVSILGIQLSASRGPLSPEEREWARRLGEHLREALQAYERMRKLAAEALAGHTLLSAFPYPMWLIDVERYVFFSNTAAQHVQQQEEHLGLIGARLALISNRADQELTLRINRLYRAGHGASTAVDLRHRPSDPPLWLHLSLMVPGHVLGAFGERPQILVTLFDPRQISHLDPFALANLFDFTPTEAKVATQIAEGLSPDEIAMDNGTRISTVRTQIRNILTKLGVERQTDIVRILRQGEALWAKS